MPRRVVLRTVGGAARAPRRRRLLRLHATGAGEDGAAAEAEAEAARRRELTLARIAGRIRHRAAAAAWHAWCALTAVGSGPSGMKLRPFSPPLRFAHHELCRESRRRESKADRILRRIKHRGVAAALDSWLEYVARALAWGRG